MEEEIDIKIDPNLCCKVCGEREFDQREGFFYCQECGTKQEQVRAIEVEREDEFNESTKKFIKKQKIQTLKLEKPDLTSWECYNYILRGLVEELLSFGAKDELKLMTLQIWAAYLRRMEVAFFNRKHAQLPKLSARFLKRDAKTLYNQCGEQRIKRKRRRSEAMNKEGESTGREWRKSKRDLDKSAYSIHSGTSGGSTLMSQSSASANTSSTGTTAHGIRLKFSSYARKQLKRIMPPKHLEKHEKDASGNLTCHSIRPLVRTFNRMDHAVHTMSLKQVFTILAIALNLIEDEIQLSDLVRFISEDHVGAKNVLQYFPPNIALQGKQLLREIDFYLYPLKYNDKALREHCGLFVRFIQINQFNKPDIKQLVLRYVTDLDLPPIVATFAERLINLLPPQFKTRAPHTYPPYEARAMAYVLFVLKLLFGLDGHKEKLISKAAHKINKKITKLNANTKSDDRQAPLFVWNEWMEYIEMRKIIVGQYNAAFSRQFKQCASTAQVLEELSEEQRCQNEEDTQTAQGALATNNRASNIKRIFEQFLQDKETPETTTPALSRLEFAPSFTPAHEYFKRILLHCSNTADNANVTTVQIPEFMHVDHTKNTLQPYLEAKTLREFFSRHNCELTILPTACSNERSYVGIFRPAEAVKFKGEFRAQLADYEISEKLWLERMVDDPPNDELEFKTELDSYERRYQKVLEAKALKRKQRENDDLAECFQDEQKSLLQCGASENKSEEIPIENFLMPSSLFREKIKSTRKRVPRPDFDVLSLHSIDIFSEYNMDPIENFNLKAPRRGLDTVNLFENLGDNDDNVNCDESSQSLSFIDKQLQTTLKEEIFTSDDDEEAKTTGKNKVTLATSNMDCWMLLGNIGGLTSTQTKLLEHKFSRTFSWLLETCANTIGVDWSILYEQLLAIELMFIYGIENLDDFRDCIRFRYNNPIKDFNMLVNSFREIW